MLKFNEKDPYLRGLITSLGFKQVPVFYKRQIRFKGQSHFPVFSKNPIFAFISGITSFSVLPLAFFCLLGFFLLMLSLVSSLILIVLKLFAISFSFFWWAIPFSLFLSALHLTGIGILGIYIGRIFNEVRTRPPYIIESTLGFEN